MGVAGGSPLPEEMMVGGKARDFILPTGCSLETKRMWKRKGRMLRSSDNMVSRTWKEESSSADVLRACGPIRDEPTAHRPANCTLL